jgi:hypothetical protein
MLSIDPAQAGFVQIVPEKTAVRSAASMRTAARMDTSEYE